ncbi:MAG: formylglycine-generating enzyme family protein [Bacteroidota bacterium]
MIYHKIDLGDLEIQLAEIPAGEILLNDDRTQKKWHVSIDNFLLAKFPVTQKLYSKVMRKAPSFFNGENLPVETVTWKDAAMFCNELSLKIGLDTCYEVTRVDGQITFNRSQSGFRLPLESEWQYACQANEPKIRYGELNRIAWYKENSENKTQEVGLKEPNKWGLYDMLGNVWEWCSDIYDAEMYKTYRVFRGGGWSDDARSVMATTRRRSHPTKFQIEDLGFRIAKNLV